MLHPIALISMLRTSSLVDYATLSVHVKVSAMISPKRISEIRSTGSSNRFAPPGSFTMGVLAAGLDINSDFIRPLK
jgi:hypothetical protein